MRLCRTNKFRFLAFLIIGGFIFTDVVGQIGTIMYETTIYPQVDLPPEAAAWASQVPDKISNNHMLLFHDQKSIYKNAPTEAKAEDDMSERGGRMMRMFRRNTDETVYIDRENQIKKTQRSFFGKEFLISDTITQNQWKIVASEQRQIGNYLCMKAILIDTTETEAWFTPQIPISLGPENYAGLPGMIMAINIPDRKVILAKQIMLGELKEEITEPTKGEKVTKAKFDKIMEEKMEEMRSMGRGGRGGGNFHFRMN